MIKKRFVKGMHMELVLSTRVGFIVFIKKTKSRLVQKRRRGFFFFLSWRKTIFLSYFFSYFLCMIKFFFFFLIFPGFFFVFYRLHRPTVYITKKCCGALLHFLWALIALKPTVHVFSLLISHIAAPLSSFFLFSFLIFSYVCINMKRKKLVMQSRAHSDVDWCWLEIYWLVNSILL